MSLHDDGDGERGEFCMNCNTVLMREWFKKVEYE